MKYQIGSGKSVQRVIGYRFPAEKEEEKPMKRYIPTQSELNYAKSLTEALVLFTIIGGIFSSFFGAFVVSQICSHEAPWAVVPAGFSLIGMIICAVRLLCAMRVIAQANRYGVMKGNRES